MRRIAFAIALCAPAAGLAGGEAVPNLNPRDLAMSAAAVAAQDSAAAVYANPAALAGLGPGAHLSLGWSLVDNRTTWSDPAGIQPDSTMRFHPALPPELYAAWSGRWGERAWGVGVGFAVPAGGNVFWPSGWPGRFEVLEVDRRVYCALLNGGIEIVPRVKLGGGLLYYRTTESLKQAINFLSSEGTGQLGAAGGALSFQVAAELEPFASIPFKIGVDYKHQAVQKLTGKGHFANPPPPLAPLALDQDVTQFFTIPNRLEIGASWRAAPWALVAATWTFERWAVYQADLITGSAGFVIDVPRDYKNGQTWRAGAEFDVLPGWKARAGFLRDFAPTPRDRQSPSIPDSDLWAGSLGVGWQATARMGFHLAYFFAKFDKVTAEGASAFPATYSSWAHIVSLGITWDEQR